MGAADWNMGLGELDWNGLIALAVEITVLGGGAMAVV